MRYWFNGEDEDYERELERVRRFGAEPPSPMAASTIVAIVFLSGFEVILVVSVLVVLFLR